LSTPQKELRLTANMSTTKESFLIIAGEKSGEEHCTSFFTELKTKLPNHEFFGVGGDLLEERGMELLYHIKDFSTWGVADALKKLPMYFKSFKVILDEVDKRNCKTAILIDFQTFNLNLAMKLKKRGVKVFYYVAPQAWAWKEWRVKKLAYAAHTLFTIIPFEKPWFKERGLERVLSVKHPLLTTFEQDLENLPEKKSKDFKTDEIELLLLPGSRHREVRFLLPVFLESVLRLRKEGFNLRISIVRTPSVPDRIYEYYLPDIDQVYESTELAMALRSTDLCFAASGTVTLTTALFQVPTVVCYKEGIIEEFIYNNFIHYDWFISLANIVHEEEVFPELIQHNVTSLNITKRARNWLEYPSTYRETLNKLIHTKQKISGDDFIFSDYIVDTVKAD